MALFRNIKRIMQKLKILRICPSHTNSEIFRLEGNLDKKSFAEQIATLRKEGILLPGGWAAGMESEGFEVFETIYDDLALQTQWCAEFSPRILTLTKSEAGFILEVLKEQVRLFNPDIIFLYAHALILVPQQLRNELLTLLEKPPLLLGYWGDELPQEMYNLFDDLDFIFCSSSIYQKRFEDWAGIPAETIGNCFDDAIEFQKPVSKKYDFIFCGRTGYRLAQHVTRYSNLLHIAMKSNLRIWGYEWAELIGPAKTPKERVLSVLALYPLLMLKIGRKLSLIADRFVGERPFLRKASRIFDLAIQAKWTTNEVLAAKEQTEEYWQGEYWYDKKPFKKLFPRRMKPLLTKGSDYYRLLAESKLVLNLHRVEDADIGNVRCYEVTGLGSCLVTDRGRELKEFFDVENDIVTFETPEECVEKVKYLLKHPEEIERISKNGQQKTLSLHLPKHRAVAIAKRIRGLLERAPDKQKTVRQDLVVHAIYDTEKNPISYDIAFFLQAAEIFRKLSGASHLFVSIVWPSDIVEIPGIPDSYNLAVDAHAKSFRMVHIAVQMSQLIPTSGIFQIKDRKFVSAPIETLKGSRVVTYPSPDNTHHSIYYRLVNENPNLMEGFSASHAAHRYIQDWLKTLPGHPKKILCITLRQYAYDKQRNSNLDAWQEFLSRVDLDEYSVVIVPDTDRFADQEPLFGGRYPVFTPPCFDADLRFALYEIAYLNMFVNNGPGSAATLSRKIRYLMFKMLAPDVPHCTEEVLMQLGFMPGESPTYAGPFQKWVWADDDADTLWSEFYAMQEKINL